MKYPTDGAATRMGDWDKKNQGHGLVSKINVKTNVNYQIFSNIAFDWLVAVLPVKQMPALKICVE